jgi:hypothetical protein
MLKLLLNSVKIQQIVLAFFRPLDSDLKFNFGIAFDSWLYPIREEAEDLASHWKVNNQQPPNLLFVNCENFQVKINFDPVFSHFDRHLCP